MGAEKAKKKIEAGRCKRAGLLATQGIRGGANRRGLERMRETGDIFFAESDREWILDGAAVHVSMVGFDNGDENERVLDSQPVTEIAANLGAGTDITGAKSLPSNLNVSFMADTKGGGFDIREPVAVSFLKAPNPNGRPNSDVVVPWVNGLDITRRSRGMWIIDYGCDTPLEMAALYEMPIRHVEERVKPARDKNKRASYREKWWIHAEPRPRMRAALSGLERFLATIRWESIGCSFG